MLNRKLLYILIILLAGLSISSSLGLGKAPAENHTWAYTGSLNDARARGTATLLQNGKVLVAGGLGTSGVLASAEIYDPAIGVWSRTGDMNTARNRHTATLLPDGKVLVAGGDNYIEPFSTAELYDPNTGIWSYTDSLDVARCSHSAVLLPNEKVLVAGGGWGGSYFISAELYDPAAGTWSTTGSMNISRDTFPLTLLSNGKVLAAAGFHNGYQIANAELYDPDTGTWSTTGDLNEVRGYPTATLLPDGKVLVAGSDFFGYSLASAELYDPASGTWSYTGSMNTPRGIHTAVRLPGGKVLVAGGWSISGPTASSELYDPATGLWSITGSLNEGRRWPGPTILLPSGLVLIAGGEGYLSPYETGPIASAELYDPGDFTATKLVDKGIAHKGDLLDYTIVAGNIVTYTLDSVLITDTLPASLVFEAGSLSASSGSWGYESGVITWTGSITASHTVTLTFEAMVSQATLPGTVITNTATINAEGEISPASAVTKIEAYRTLLPCAFKPCPPIFEDDFSNPASGWAIESGDGYALGYTSGQYFIKISQDWIAWAVRDFGVTDYRLQVDAKAYSNAAGGAVGVMFDANNAGFLLFVISDGWYSVWSVDWDTWTWSPVIPWVSNPAINPGLQTNRMGIERRGRDISLYVNDQLLGALPDWTYQGTGIGMVSEAWSGSFEGRFDNFSLNVFSCGGQNALNTLATSPISGGILITPGQEHSRR